MVNQILTNPQPQELVAQEERIYRNWARKCTEAEERSTLLESLARNGVGLPDVENFARMEE